jgi:NhaP-type Na+/H+ or K+/H+ antiporter
VPNYPTHARWGRIGAVVTALAVGGALYYLFETIPLAGAAALGAAATTFVGAIYPDIDHHNSIPRRKATRSFQALVVLGILSLAGLGWDPLLSAVESGAQTAGVALPAPTPVVAAAVTAVVAAIAAALVDPAIGVATDRHRGWTHNPLVNSALTAAIGAAVWLVTAGLPVHRRVAAVVVVATFFVGALIHLGLDGEIV